MLLMSQLKNYCQDQCSNALPHISFIGDFTISVLNFRSLVHLVCFNRFRVYFYAWCRINIQYNSFAHISMFSRTICWIDYLYYAALALLWKTFRLYLCAFISGLTIHFQIGTLPLHASFMLFYFHLWSILAILVAESVRSLALLCMLFSVLFSNWVLFNELYRF